MVRQKRQERQYQFIFILVFSFSGVHNTKAQNDMHFFPQQQQQRSQFGWNTKIQYFTLFHLRSSRNRIRWLKALTLVGKKERGREGETRMEQLYAWRNTTTTTEDRRIFQLEIALKIVHLWLEQRSQTSPNKYFVNSLY